MEEKDTIDLRKYVTMAKRKWYLYVISAVVFLALAITYHFYHMDQYNTYATILIEDEGESAGGGGGSVAKAMGGGMASIMRTFSIGGLGSSSVDNELLIFQSHDILVKTIKQLGLNFTYIDKSEFKKKNLYKDSPVLVACKNEILDTLSTGFKLKIKLHKDGKADVKAEKGFFGKVIGEKSGANLPTTVSTPYGDFQVVKSAKYKDGEEQEITVNVASTELVAKSLVDFLIVDYSSKKGDGIALEFKTSNKEYGKDLLNGMMGIYNQIRLKRKNDNAAQSLEFYDKMIDEITASLDASEQKMQDFQTKNNIVSPETEATYFFGTDKETENQIIGLRDRISLYNLVLNMLADPKKKYELLPSTSDEATSMTIRGYNELILKKRNMELSATSDNIALKQVVNQIDAMRGLVADNIALVKKNAETTISSLKGINSSSKSKLGKTPYYQREYINLMRDKELKNDLYVFLLEKRYNSAMTLASNLPQGFVIDPAYCDIKPLMKKSLIGLGACVFMALVLPTVIVCIIVNRKSKKKEEDTTAED